MDDTTCINPLDIRYNDIYQKRIFCDLIEYLLSVLFILMFISIVKSISQNLWIKNFSEGGVNQGFG